MAFEPPNLLENGEVERATKRTKMNDHNPTNDRSYRRRSPLQRGRKERHQKSHTDWARERAVDSYHPNNERRSQRQRSASPGRAPRPDFNAQGKNKKSTKDRKENPSSRIHSLRNLLERGSLPATVKQEKERELAGLLFDQQKQLIKQAGKKNLKRYHFIRFVERQKANRMLKKLKKTYEGQDIPGDIQKQIHELEVDLNYTIYAPLAQKYISIYARDESVEGKPLALARNLSGMKKRDYIILSDEQRYEIEQSSLEASNILQVADIANGVKPPMWYMVEAKMKEGQKALDTLRDEELKLDHLKSELVIGTGAKKTPAWLDDDGNIDPEDLDSESDGDDGGAIVKPGDGDEEMSDGDGGFFEKR